MRHAKLRIAELPQREKAKRAEGAPWTMRLF